jgi:hypothetical protein
MNTQALPTRRDWPFGKYQSPLIATRALETLPFADAGHLSRNGRYLFSQTETHPANGRTHLNTFASFDGAGEIVSLQANTDPKAAAQAYLDTVAGRENLAASLRMDLHYAAFLYPSPEERVFYSNFINGEALEEGGGLEIDDCGLEIIAHDIGTDDPRALEHTVATHLAVGDRVLPWEQAPEEVRFEIFYRAFRTIQRKHKRLHGYELLREAEAQRGPIRSSTERQAILDQAHMPECVLAISHADQEAMFHIHRVFKA